MSTQTDERTAELGKEAQAHIDDLSTRSGVMFAEPTAVLLRRVYLEGRAAGVEWAKALITSV